MKNFTFNKVYIVRSLDLDISKKDYWEPGDKLKDALTNSGINCNIIDVQHGLLEYQQVMQSIKNECITDEIRPIIHFICHGVPYNKYSNYPNGAMALWNADKNNDECIEWTYILQMLEEVNLASRLNLFVTMSVCHGFYSLLKILDPHYRIPFCGILASPDPVYVLSSQSYFVDFYLALINNKDVYAAQQALHDCFMSFKDAYEREGIKMEEQIVLFTDNLFSNAARGDFKLHRSTRDQLQKTAIDAYHDYGIVNPSEQQIEAFIQANYQFFWKEFTMLRDYKFMLDLYPENKDRLELPMTIIDLQK